MSSFLPIAFGAIALALTSCGPQVSMRQAGSGGDYLAGIGVTSTSNVPFNPAEASKFWDGDTISGSPMIRINRREQKAYFYKSGQLVGISPISTGDAEHTTPPGSFKVTQKSKDHASSLYGRIVDVATGATIVEEADSKKDIPGPGQAFVGAPMPHFLRFNWGIGMHAGYLPGYPASHGCVRMPADMAKKFFEHSEIGTPVIVE